MSEKLNLSPDFLAACDLVENTSHHVFVTGKAGSGKSTWLEYCRHHSAKNIVVTAPTGVAALNVHGQTIHRFFGFPINISVEKIISREFSPRAKRIYQKLQTLIIDEVSMLRADILDCIDAFLRLYGPVSGVPFGGVQMVFVGDLYQLPPVITKTEEPLFYQKYPSPYFFSAHVFKSIPLQVVELTTVFRQKDPEFIALLDRIRRNMLTPQDLATLNQRLHTAAADDDFRISLTTLNRLADEINHQQMAQLPGQLYSSQAVIDGSFSAESYPAAENLEFKLGAQIMFLNNDSKNRWVNGSIGHIENLTLRDGKLKHLRVRLQEDRRLVEVFPYSWEIYKYTLQGTEIIEEVAGSFTQFPFRPAWAVTIHKSQGKTFDKVEIDVGRGAFATGQLYVALSRCTSLNGISLKKAVRASDVFVDQRVVGFMRQYCALTLDEQQDKAVFFAAAIPQRLKLKITYQKPDGTISPRIIIPLHIKGGNLLAFCTQRQEQRTFCLERIKTAQEVKE